MVPSRVGTIWIDRVPCVPSFRSQSLTLKLQYPVGLRLLRLLLHTPAYSLLLQLLSLQSLPLSFLLQLRLLLRTLRLTLRLLLRTLVSTLPLSVPPLLVTLCPLLRSLPVL